MTEGGPTVTSIARGGTNLVRPHQGAVRPNNAIRSAQGRCEPTAGHSHLSTPDSILMCYRKLTTRVEIWWSARSALWPPRSSEPKMYGKRDGRNHVFFAS